MRPDSDPKRTLFDSPSPRDWQVFRSWAALEGWRVPAAELALYREELADSAFVLRAGSGVPFGFVTVCRHRRSGWIGNLIVAPERRGAGHGRQLFNHAVSVLTARGARTLWLTASPDGRPLYERSGFREIGRVERWVWRGAAAAAGGAPRTDAGALPALTEADAAAWGDERAGLLAALARGGRIATAADAAALLQAGEGLRVLGPWLSRGHCPRSARAVLGELAESFGGGGEVAVDLLAGVPERALLAAAGFCQSGESVLMTRGGGARERLAQVVALASLGSMG